MVKFLSIIFGIPRPEADWENQVFRTLVPHLRHMVHVPQIPSGSLAARRLDADPVLHLLPLFQLLPHL